MNPLNAHPHARRIAYYVQFVVAGLVLLTAIGYGSAGVEPPTWYAVVAAVTSAAWSYLGLTAAQNTPKPPARGERGAIDAGTAILVAVLVVLLLILFGVGTEIR